MKDRSEKNVLAIYDDIDRLYQSKMARLTLGVTPAGAAEVRGAVCRRLVPQHHCRYFCLKGLPNGTAQTAEGPGRHRAVGWGSAEPRLRRRRPG